MNLDQWSGALSTIFIGNLNILKEKIEIVDDKD